MARAPQENLLAQVSDLKVPNGKAPPDIYYIILDTYTRADTLSSYFSYNNDGFLTDLENKGFYVARRSQSNYSYTALSLASMMQDYVAGFDNQVTYLNQRLLAIVDGLVRDSSEQPIIIIQGDHGTPRLVGWNDTILNAYYLPDGGDTQLYQSISPVNTFRVIFDHYFEGNLPLLADHSCTTNSTLNPYGCTRVSASSPQCMLTTEKRKP